MNLNHSLIVAVFLHLTLINKSVEVNFLRVIEEAGGKFYKILMLLGSCKEVLLFREQKVWGTVRLNRIMDIYYKSLDDKHTVSRVEISLVTNNTDCFAVSASGLGELEFTATLFLPTNLGITLYKLEIFTCYTGEDSSTTEVPVLDIFK